MGCFNCIDSLLLNPRLSQRMVSASFATRYENFPNNFGIDRAQLFLNQTPLVRKGLQIFGILTYLVFWSSATAIFGSAVCSDIPAGPVSKEASALLLCL